MLEWPWGSTRPFDLFVWTKCGPRHSGGYNERAKATNCSSLNWGLFLKILNFVFSRIQTEINECWEPFLHFSNIEVRLWEGVICGKVFKQSAMHFKHSEITKAYGHVAILQTKIPYTLQTNATNLEWWEGFLPHWEVWQAEFEDGAQDCHLLMYTLCEDKYLPLSVRRTCIYDITVGIRLHFMA